MISFIKLNTFVSLKPSSCQNLRYKAYLKWQQLLLRQPNRISLNIQPSVQHRRLWHHNQRRCPQQQQQKQQQQHQRAQQNQRQHQQKGQQQWQHQWQQRSRWPRPLFLSATPVTEWTVLMETYKSVTRGPSSVWTHSNRAGTGVVPSLAGRCPSSVGGSGKIVYLVCWIVSTLWKSEPI